MEIGSLLSIILPKEISKYFDLVKTKEEQGILEFYLEERNEIPEGYTAIEYESKGFFNEQTIQDFPIRGKEVYLKIKRRRWRHKTTSEEISRNWESVSSGSKLTVELATFLKEFDRSKNR